MFRHFAALLIAFVLAVLAWVASHTSCILYKHDVTRSATAMIAQQLNYGLISSGDPIPVTDESVRAINSWLSGASADGHPITHKFGEVGDWKTDGWGSAYRCVKISSTNASGHMFGIYSLGEDRKSDSEGNDSDDINTWAPHPTSFYRRRIAVSEVFTFAMFFGVACLFVFAIVGASTPRASPATAAAMEPSDAADTR